VKALAGLLLACASLAAHAQPGEPAVVEGQLGVAPSAVEAAPPAVEAAPVMVESAPTAAAPEREIGEGMASWYGPGLHGRRTASGERFDQHALTAAHRTLPFGTVVRVRSLVNGRSVEVRINDRGPYMKRRVIDLSRAAAQALGLIESGRGVKRVALSVLGPQAVR
jgi:rare lipoprotein A